MHVAMFPHKGFRSFFAEKKIYAVSSSFNLFCFRQSCVCFCVLAFILIFFCFFRRIVCDKKSIFSFLLTIYLLDCFTQRFLQTQPSLLTPCCFVDAHGHVNSMWTAWRLGRVKEPMSITRELTNHPFVSLPEEVIGLRVVDNITISGGVAQSNVSTRLQWKDCLPTGHRG